MRYNTIIKRFQTVLLVTLLPVFMWSQQVTYENAKNKATAFLSRQHISSAGVQSAPKKAPELTVAIDRDEFYVFNDKANGGFVVVSGDERMPEILGFSTEGTIDSDSIPCNIKAWLEEYADQVNYLREHPDAEVTTANSPERETIPPLIDCIFFQSSPFNDKCPILPNGRRCAAGCVAIAMAQIMFYYQWPEQTSMTIPGYTTSRFQFEMPDIPVTTIDWDNILGGNSYNKGNYNNVQADAAATLTLLCGASVQMDYSGQSGAISDDAAAALRQYFDYDAQLDLLSRYLYNDDDWGQLLYDELKEGRPVYYAGANSTAGHAFVIDGYGYEGEPYFHIKWGTNLYYPNAPLNSYFLLTDVGGWNNGQEAIIGIKPNDPNGPKEYAVVDDGKISFYYDKKIGNRTGTIYPGLRRCLDNGITECVFDPSFSGFKAKNLSYFFLNCHNLTSITGLEYLNTSDAIDIHSMFSGCNSLTDLDLSSFNTANATSLNHMFKGCSSLTNLDLSNFSTANVQDMMYMFLFCSSLTNLDLSGFNTANVIRMDGMFDSCSSLKKIDLSSFNTANVTSMLSMFYGCSSLTDLDLSNFNTANVTSLYEMFYGCSSLTDLDLSNFNTANVTSMDRMFYNCSSLKNLDLSSFNTANVTSLHEMFYGCSSLTHLDLSSFNTANVTSMHQMFSLCSSLTNLDLSSFNTANVTSMYEMFWLCSSLKSLDLSSFNTEKTTDTSLMFLACSSLTDLDLSRFNTANVTSMFRMFNGCSSLKKLDLSSFNTSNVSSMGKMFNWCRSLKTIYVSEGWDVSNVEDGGNQMFWYCDNLEGEKGTHYSEGLPSNIEYAHIDGGDENPGYLTYKESAGIEAVTSDLVPADVYRLDGIRVRTAAQGLAGLPAGVYIVGRKKIIIP